MTTANPDISARKPGRPDIEGDRRRLWEVIQDGGIAIVPSDLGYGIWAGSPDGLRRINEVKRRGSHKRSSMLMGRTGQREIHILDQYKRDIIDCVTLDYNLPLGVIAKYRTDHPLVKKVDSSIIKIGTAQGTMSAVVNAGGPFNEYASNMSLQHLHPIFGSSANITGSGVKFRVEDIEPEIVEIADIVLDYGIRRCHPYIVSSTQINFETMQVIRIGSYYELISDILKRHFDWDLPPDPGRDVNPSGHLQEFALEGLVE